MGRRTEKEAGYREQRTEDRAGRKADIIVESREKREESREQRAYRREQRDWEEQETERAGTEAERER